VSPRAGLDAMVKRKIPGNNKLSYITIKINSLIISVFFHAQNTCTNTDKHNSCTIYGRIIIHKHVIFHMPGCKV